MDQHLIEIARLNLQPFTAFDPGGVLLLSGSGVDDANLMTISWGLYGIMWGKPIMMVMVRPTRHTWGFITRVPDFTVNWLDASWADALALCGSASGRDTEKFAATGLTPVPAAQVQSPALRESALVLECRTVYRDEVKPEQFLDPALEGLYPQKDYHGLFFGEIVSARGVAAFRCG